MNKNRKHKKLKPGNRLQREFQKPKRDAYELSDKVKTKDSIISNQKVKSEINSS